MRIANSSDSFVAEGSLYAREVVCASEALRDIASYKYVTKLKLRTYGTACSTTLLSGVNV